MQISRGQRQAYLRASGCRAAAGRGTKVPATLVAAPRARAAGAAQGARCGCRPTCGRASARVVFTGADVDSGEGDLEDLFEFFDIEFDLGSRGGDLGARNVRRLVAGSRGSRRYDGVSARRPGRDPEDFDPGEPSYRDPDLRISGACAARRSASAR